MQYAYFFQDSKLPQLVLSGPIESVYTSQPLHIPAYLIGGAEVRMRVKYRDKQDNATVYSDPYNQCTIIWYKENNQNSLRRSFFVEMDSQFHTYQIPFTIYKPDWTQDAWVTKIEILTSNILSEVELEYVKLLPYKR